MPTQVAPEKALNLDIAEVLSVASGSSDDSNLVHLSSSSDSDKRSGKRSRKSSRIWLKSASNRETYGTWKNPMDFTVTLIGYVLGIHNFFRFPHMCYKYGTLTFLVPYLVLILILGFPVLFMECTIGQFYGTGSATAFRQLAPILSGVGYILAWNSFLNTWIYGIMLTWTRCYSGDSLSCLRGWVGCYEGHVFNTPHCYTSVLDDCCSGLASLSDFELCPDPNDLNLPSGQDTPPDFHPFNKIYYNFKCVDAGDFCNYFGWKLVGHKVCEDTEGKMHSIYERRTHANAEYLYGFVLGMRRIFVSKSREIGFKLCEGIVGPDEAPKVCKQPHLDARVREKIFTDPQYTNLFWEGTGQHLQADSESSSFLFLPGHALTTVIFITFFVYADVLSVSGVSYVMATLPFAILIFIGHTAVNLSGSTAGVNDLLSIRGIENLWGSKWMELWADAAIQVIISSGIGNGALISLASFNKQRHTYLFDVLVVTFLNILTSLMATFVCFCSIGHYVKHYGISQQLTSFIHLESYYSSVDFGYYVFSFLLTILDGDDLTLFFYFFMLSSFPTDTTIRLAQNMLDTAVQFLPRLRYHSTMALLGTTFFFLVSLLPITRNGGILIFLEFEYYAHKFAMPLVTLIEVVAVAWVYKAKRLMDDAELLGVTQRMFRIYIIFCLKFCIPLAMTLLLLHGVVYPIPAVKIHAIKSYEVGALTPIISGLFALTPLILFLLSVLKQLARLPRKKWPELCQPLLKWEVVKRQTNVFRKTDIDILSSRETLTNKSSENHLRGKKVRISLGGEPEVNEDEAPEEDNVSVSSSVIAKWKSYILWTQIVAHFEDWPDRLDDSEMESEGSSQSSDADDDLKD